MKKLVKDDFFSAKEDIGYHKEELDSEEKYNGRRNKPIYREKEIENQGCIQILQILRPNFLICNYVSRKIYK